ncbi:MAG: hypothetical protein KDJ52_13790 [Anaerolineae bacterium]|nr:hypothetical protein [Anaerolineae bacterium]
MAPREFNLSSPTHLHESCVEDERFFVSGEVLQKDLSFVSSPPLHFKDLWPETRVLALKRALLVSEDCQYGIKTLVSKKVQIVVSFYAHQICDEFLKSQSIANR